MATERSNRRGELFYVDSEGKRRDAELHAEILDNPRADLWCRISSFMYSVLNFGSDPQDAQEVFALTDKDLAGELFQEVVAEHRRAGLPVYIPPGVDA